MDTSLYAVYGIKKFAQYLVLEYSKRICRYSDFNTSFDHFMKIETSKIIFERINLLLRYKNITDEITIKEFEDRCFLSSKRQYMEQLLSRCLMLSEGEPTFLEFLLVCVYVGKFTELIFAKYPCCKIWKLTGDCLESVYCRKYKDYFDENDGFLGLARYCRSSSFPFIEIEEEGDETTFEATEPKLYEKLKNLKNLNAVDNIISLNPMEGKLLMDRPYTGIQHTSDPKKFNDFLIDLSKFSGTDQDNELEHVYWMDPANVCDHCFSLCSKYPTRLVDDLQEHEVWRNTQSDNC